MIRIITDSLCDLTMDYAKELNIDIMPLTVRFGEDDFTILNVVLISPTKLSMTNLQTTVTILLPPLSIHLNSRKFSKNTSMPAMKSWQSSFPNT